MQWKIRENVYFVSTINHFVNMLEKTRKNTSYARNEIIGFEILNSRHDSIKFTMEKEANNTLSFFDVFINNKDPTNLIASVFHFP